MQKNFMKEMYRNGATVKIIEEVSMPCARGFREMFPHIKAFLCYFENLPFKKPYVMLSEISGFTVIGDPWAKLRDWTEDPLEFVDSEWDESDLLSENPEEAIAEKIKDLEKIWQSSLRTRCTSCKARGEQCKKQLKSLNKAPPSKWFNQI